EKDICNLPSIFSEMLKDEVNANDEQRIYNGIKRIIKKYSEEKNGISIVNELIGVLSGGASLEEILQITKEEALNPTLATGLTVDDSCSLKNKTQELH
ncbi:MAG: hypothetical protein ACOYWZ_02270, partial [Bacillota bacterium]